MLKVTGLHAWYEHSHILQGVGLEVNEGEIVAANQRNDFPLVNLQPHALQDMAGG